jgi:regulator of cell morphogenesis and NO signaling
MVMTDATLAEALEREHHEIDEGIEAFTADPSSEPARDRLRTAIRALRRHIYLEEEFAFPPLREAGFVMPIIVMLREHGQIWTTCDSLEQALADGADNATLLQLCRQLTVQLQHHNLKEEKVLYPQVDTTMSASAAADLRAFLDRGQLPEGWVCARAGV